MARLKPKAWDKSFCVLCTNQSQQSNKTKQDQGNKALAKDWKQNKPYFLQNQLLGYVEVIFSFFKYETWGLQICESKSKNQS